MSLIKNIGNAEFADLRLDPKEADKWISSEYAPSEEERTVRQMLIRQFILGYQTMYKPRREFNDLSVIGRQTIDQMSFNTYQPNNGEAAEGDLINSWKSNAVRPIVRNKCISIAAHATAHLLFPKVFASNDSSEYQKDASKVMEELMEWTGDRTNYAYTSLQSVITALWSPASIFYTEYGDVYRNQKTEKDESGKWKVEEVLDEENSGFKDVIVPVDEFYIENIYEHDLQKQGWIIWRRVISYDSAKSKYQHLPNWKFVKPGVQIIFNDANQTFYEQYDTNMRPDMVEEVLYWNKGMDLRLEMVNAVLLSDFDEPNPRRDKKYPFGKFGYELLDEGKFFYYKSLAFKLQQDANIINTLYPLIIDGTYLSVMPPMINIGSETIGSDVIVPGAVTTLTDPESKVNPINVAQNVGAGFNMLSKIDESLSDTAKDTQIPTTKVTAYQMSRIEQQAATVLGLFIQMISQFVKQYGTLRCSDIIQYLTIADVEKITDDSELIYKSFMVKGTGKHEAKKIHMDGSMSDENISEEDHLKMSYDLLNEGKKKNMEIWKVNPRMMRDFKYQMIVSPDVLQPKSEEFEHTMKLELYDRGIQNPAVDQEKLTKDFLFGAYKSIRDPEEYIKKQQMMQGQPQQDPFALAKSPIQPNNQALPQAPAMSAPGARLGL